VRRTLEKALTQAILDGRVADGGTVRAGLADDGGIALDVPQPALAR